mgnify:CR=1 FL=1
MKSLLPVILVILLLTGAIVFSLTKSTITKIIPKQFGIPATELEVIPVTPTPSATPTLTVTPTTDKPTNRNTDKPVIIPTLTAKKPVSSTKGGQVSTANYDLRTTKTTQTTICTPVYGMANTCTEHIVVDTAGESDLFFSFAGLSYLAGLIAFVKSKYA